jgi:hypothetical protein
MSAAVALAFATQALAALPAMIQAGQTVIRLIETTNAALHAMGMENRDPSPAEWAALNAQTVDLLARLDAASADPAPPQPPAAA